MAGKAHFRVRGVNCGRCSKTHTWYKYRVWREGKKVKEEYVGRCDQYGNTDFKRSSDYHRTQHDHAGHPPHTNARSKRSPYEVLGITYTATKADINQVYRKLVKQYHPDRNPHTDPRIIVEINVAYQTLMK